MAMIVKPLIQKSIDEGIDYFNVGDNTRVFTQCLKCGEIFMREKGLLNLAHACSKYYKSNSEWIELCKCGGRFDKCEECSMPESEAARLAKRANKKYGANIKPDDVIKQWKKQRGLCFRSECRIRPFINSTNVVILDDSYDLISGNFVLAIDNAGAAPAVRLEYKILVDGAKPPFRKRSTDVGYDVASVEDVTVPAHWSVDVSTGIAVAVPPGYYFTVDGRSSMSQNGIIPFRGIIDSGYCGHLKVALMNVSDEDYHILAGDRIAQIIIHRQLHGDFTEVDEFGPDYRLRGNDGCAGWGSSGK